MRRIILAFLLGLTGLAFALAQAPASADDDKAIRAAADAYAAAFNKGNLDGILALYAADADFTDENGKQYKGKAALAELFKKSLVEFKGHKMKTQIVALRFLRPDVALEDGKAEITGPDGIAESGRYTAVWTKTGGKWLLASVRDLPEAPAAADSATARLKELEWLVGDWVHEDPKISVQVSGRWTLNKSFLLLEYTVKGKDSEDLAVAQFFGWDPLQGQIRSWFFDSKGGHGGGDWARKGNTWTSAWSGVLAEGRTAASVNSMKFIDDKSFLWRSVDREIDGLPMTDVEVKFVRKASGK